MAQAVVQHVLRRVLQIVVLGAQPRVVVFVSLHVRLLVVKLVKVNVVQMAVKPPVPMLAHLAHPHVLQVVKHRVQVVKQHVQLNAHLHVKHRVDLDVLIDAQINALVALAHAVLDVLLHAFLVAVVHVILDVVDLVKDLVPVAVKILARLHVIPNVLQDARVAVTHLVKTPVELVALTDVLIVA